MIALEAEFCICRPGDGEGAAERLDAPNEVDKEGATPKPKLAAEVDGLFEDVANEANDVGAADNAGGFPVNSKGMMGDAQIFVRWLSVAMECRGLEVGGRLVKDAVCICTPPLACF